MKKTGIAALENFQIVTESLFYEVSLGHHWVNYGGLNSLFSLFLVISKHFGENFHGFEKNACSNNLASLQEIVEEGISKEEPVFITLPND